MKYVSLDEVLKECRNIVNKMTKFGFNAQGLEIAGWLNEFEHLKTIDLSTYTNQIEALKKEIKLLKDARCTHRSVCREFRSEEYQRMCHEPKELNQ